MLVGGAVLFFAVLFPYIRTTSAADTTPEAQINANTEQITALTKKIAEYQAQLLKVGADKKTLQSAIATLDLERKSLESQVAVIQKQIDTTQVQIKQLDTSITKTEKSIAKDRAALGASLRTMQLADERPLVADIISSRRLADVWIDIDASEQLLNRVRQNIGTLREHRDSLTTSQTASKKKQEALTSQKQSLTSEQKQLAATKQSKNQLLTDTKAQEANYQKLLAQAKAELASYTAFTTNAGGSKLLANQTSCDEWGCYFSQRDTIWGGMRLRGSSDTLAAAGCLVTTMAMIMTHYGHTSVTPVSINADPGNFSSVGGLLLFTIRVDGATAVRQKIAAIDAALATGNPLVIGVHAYGGTHYVVFTSGSKGKYLMRDPYVANGKDINFTSHYSLGSIFHISKVIVTG